MISNCLTAPPFQYTFITAPHDTTRVTLFSGSGGPVVARWTQSRVERSILLWGKFQRNVTLLAQAVFSLIQA